MSDVVRITCVKSDCGTFPLDRALYAKLKRTGEWFTCPDGHKQHFTESPEKQLRDRIENLEVEVDRLEGRLSEYRDTSQKRWEERNEERKRRKHVEELFLSESVGVVEIYDGEYMWACECGGSGRKHFEDPDDAWSGLRDHLERQGCDPDDTPRPADVLEGP